MKPRTRNPEETRQRLIDATITLVLGQGYAATTVDQICAESGLTKGGFFHHFANKEAIGRATIARWGEIGTSLYSPAWYDETSDPLVRIGRFLSIMAGFTEREAICTCVVGMMSQEISQSHESMRADAARELAHWTKETARLFALAKEKHHPAADFDPEEIAWFLNSLWQGSMLVGKATADPKMIRRNLEFARTWIAGFFPENLRHLLNA
ncbi:MAG: TetR/AcrR family transcriptional regulator [Verrucomicrobiota bacterium]